MNANVEFEKVCGMDSLFLTPFETLFCNIRVTLNKIAITNKNQREYFNKKKELLETMN